MAVFKAAAVQFNCATGAGAYARNVEKALGLLERAAAEGAKLAVLPETFDFGYDLEGLKTASVSAASTTIARLERFAADRGVHVVAGIAESEAGKTYNRSVLIAPSGLVARYTKIHLFSSAPTWEDRTFVRGSERSVRNTELGELGQLICYDLRFPELPRALALEGARVLTVSSAWPFGRKEPFEVLVKARAIENQLFVVSANQVGDTAAGLKFGGTSMIVGPLGDVLARADDAAETVVVADVDLSKIDEARGFMNCFGHRIPETYAADAGKR